MAETKMLKIELSRLDMLALSMLIDAAFKGFEEDGAEEGSVKLLKRIDNSVKKAILTDMLEYMEEGEDK